MTTQVKVLNEGPAAVKVEVQGRNDQGQYYQIQESQLLPGQFKTLIITDRSSIQVIELKGAPPVEPA